MRVIYSPPQDGITNMAGDHAIMEAVGEGFVPPTLRLYAWQPACLSLGYAQRLRDVDQPRLQALGWTLVRRPTGGRAILHTDELTYSISLPQDHPLVEGDIVTSYHRLSNALRHALSLLGVKTAALPQDHHMAVGAVCFNSPADYEITVQGKKLVGSAQVRRHKAVLQHGTLPLYGDLGRICEVLHYKDALEREAAHQTLKQQAITLEAAAGRHISWQVAANALQQGFEESFDLHFERAWLSPRESLRLEQLRSEVYGAAAWTAKR